MILHADCALIRPRFSHFLPSSLSTLVPMAEEAKEMVEQLAYSKGTMRVLVVIDVFPDMGISMGKWYRPLKQQIDEDGIDVNLARGLSCGLNVMQPM